MIFLAQQLYPIEGEGKKIEYPSTRTISTLVRATRSLKLLHYTLAMLENAPPLLHYVHRYNLLKYNLILKNLISAR
jgi:hypothetical protein